MKKNGQSDAKLARDRDKSAASGEMSALISGEMTGADAKVR